MIFTTFQPLAFAKFFFAAIGTLSIVMFIRIPLSFIKLPKNLITLFDDIVSILLLTVVFLAVTHWLNDGVIKYYTLLSYYIGIFCFAGIKKLLKKVLNKFIVITDTSVGGDEKCQPKTHKRKISKRKINKPT